MVPSSYMYMHRLTGREEDPSIVESHHESYVASEKDVSIIKAKLHNIVYKHMGRRLCITVQLCMYIVCSGMHAAIQ